MYGWGHCKQAFCFTAVTFQKAVATGGVVGIGGVNEAAPTLSSQQKVEARVRIGCICLDIKYIFKLQCCEIFIVLNDEVYIW